MNGTPSTSSPSKTTPVSTPHSSREALLERVGSIPVPVSVQLCQRRMTLEQFITLRPGSFIPFPTRCDEPLKLQIDGSTVALGEVVRCGTQLGLRLNHIAPKPIRSELIRR